MKTIDVGLEARSCELCRGQDLDLLWSNRSIVRKTDFAYQFRVHVVVCRTCGFCFTSPSAKADDLQQYYADGLSSYKGIGLAYSIERRLSILEKYRAPDGVFVEVSGDRADEFQRRSKAFFKEIINVEASEDAPAEFRSVKELPDNSADVIAHYDVLEHVSTVRPFLTECRRALKEGGIMICEVPDLRLYPRNLLLFEFEHVNHFSVSTLAMIGGICGLRLIEVSHVCSRPFGFATVFRKDHSVQPALQNSAHEYLDAVACVQGGMNQIGRVFEQIDLLKTKVVTMAGQGAKVTLWGVTDLLRRFLDGYRLPETAVVVDMDPRRRDHLATQGITVFEPKDQLSHIRNSELLAIFAPRYYREIVEWVHQRAEKGFGGERLAVIGTGLSGEPLM